MWKKFLSWSFFGSFFAVMGNNIVSCNIIKQKQLSFNLKDWQNSWAFTTQSIWQALGKAKKGVLLEESKGLFLKVINSEEGKTESFDSDQLFQIFDNYKFQKSQENHLETYLQLKYFVPSIIYYNEKIYSDSPLKDWTSIDKNFEFQYKSSASTKIDEEIDQKNGMPEDQSGPVSELILNVDTNTTLNAYFELTIKLKNPEFVAGKMVTEDGYYIDTGNDDLTETEITWKMGVYFFLPTF